MRIKFLFGRCGVATAPIILNSLAFSSITAATANNNRIAFVSSSFLAATTRFVGNSIQQQQQGSSLLASSSGGGGNLLLFGQPTSTKSSTSTTSTTLFVSGRMMGTGPSSYYKNNDETIIKALTQSKTIALIGASKKTNRPAYYVMEYLLSKGYNVIPVNPGLDGQTLLGQTVYKSLSDIPIEIQNTIDMIDIFRNSNTVEPIIDEVILLLNSNNNNNNIKTIWMQVGVINEFAAEKAINSGLDVIMNACPKIEIPRFGITGPIEAVVNPVSEL